MINAGLVLEGGGMKGIYTAGVLDFFLDKNLSFAYYYGVSAGACTMSSFLSKQKGRGRDVMLDYLNDRHYMGLYSLATTGDIFNVDTNYNLIPNYLNPYDYDAFAKHEGKAFAVVTDIESGEAVYHELTDMEKDIDYIRASSSLPLVSKNVKIDGHLYLDGGIADSIPIKRSEADGNVKNIVVMTKSEGYRREPEKTVSLIKAKYRKYPKVYELMKNRHVVYNETVDYIEEQASQGKLFLIRPHTDLEISRLEKDSEKLSVLYEQGYNDAASKYEAMMEYLNEK
ncbi:MAG: patatin family protein [Lachnospiraceae bacterium]|nr:patatin family protein [Lachnospiraceae bacterium]